MVVRQESSAADLYFARFLSEKKGVTKVAQKERDLSAIVGTKKHLIVIDLELGVVMRLKR